MQTQSLQTQLRTGSGKGAARRLRTSGLIPAVIYGPGMETTSVTVSPKDLTRALSTEHGRNAVLSLQIDGREELALLKSLAVHPVSRAPVHADFYRVELTREVTVEVPFRTQGRALGVTKGGEMNVVFRTLPVRALPDRIPAFIEVDVTNLDMNDALLAKDLNLPEGVRVTLSPARTLVVVAERRRSSGPEEEGGAGAAAAAPGAPGASTPPPAAAGKAPAAAKAPAGKS